MAYTLNGNDLGDVQSEEHNQWSDLEQIAYPLSGTSSVTVMDYQGVKRIITIRGRYSTTTLALLANWVAAIDALQNGAQTTVVYHSDLWDASTSGNYTAGNFNVKVARFVPIYSSDYIAFSVNYMLTLYEGEEGV